MSEWEFYFKQGKKHNCTGDYTKARKLLESALEGCPDEDSVTAGRIVFEIGRSFFGMGMRGIAVKNMLAAVKMGAAESHTGNMMECLLNEYGMPARTSQKDDDEAAFTAIHVMRYLYTKKSARFGTLAEKDMIHELIADAWSDFYERIDIRGLSTREKISRYREYVIFFPTFSVPDEYNSAEDRVIYADFGSDLCSCGSGLPYMWCCGRIKSLDELENGDF